MDKKQGGFPDTPIVQGQPLGGAQFYGDEDFEDFEERAAIMEYDGGLSKEEAERRARACIEAEKSTEGVETVPKGIYSARNSGKTEMSIELCAERS